MDKIYYILLSFYLTISSSIAFAEISRISQTESFLKLSTIATTGGGSFKTKNFSRALNAASGDVSYTGIGFKPTVAIFICNLDGQESISVGYDDGTAHACTAIYGNTGTYSTGGAIYAVNSAGTAYQLGYVKSWDSDGFTITWLLFGSTAGTINCGVLCMK